MGTKLAAKKRTPPPESWAWQNASYGVLSEVDQRALGRVLGDLSGGGGVLLSVAEILLSGGTVRRTELVKARAQVDAYLELPDGFRIRGKKIPRSALETAKRQLSLLGKV